jgi:hypothetical protein
MVNKQNIKQTPSRSSPRGGKRGCLCKDTLKYSVKCCDGSLWSQGIGPIYGQPAFGGAQWQLITDKWEDINTTWN